MKRYVWQSPTWPIFSWDSSALLIPLGRTRQVQGELLAAASSLALSTHAEVLGEEALTTAAIEGEKLDRDTVRSSVARRLGLSTAGLSATERRIDGLVTMLADAAGRYTEPLDETRLKGWHAALFPTGYSGLHPIAAGQWRSGSEPMRVVSGPVGREKVHFEAPPADRLDEEMGLFLSWFGAPPAGMDGLLRAALASFWFVTIHPFQDGNGRIARAIADMALAQDDRQPFRLYSMSAQILAERNDYYAILEKTQKGDGDLTPWLVWFWGCLERAIRRSDNEISRAQHNAQLWQSISNLALNERQRKVINRLCEAGPEGFEGGLTNQKYRGITHSTRESAKRDIADLVAKGILKQNPGGGRSTNYDLVWPG